MPDLPRSNRRDFLVGRAAGDALVHVVQEAADRISQLADHLDPLPTDNQPRKYISVLKRRAMACDFEVRLNSSPGQCETAETRAAISALDLIDSLESQLTVYRDTSDVVDINRFAADRPVEVEAGLFELLQLAEQIHLDTEGAHDLTSGPLSRAWGFHTREGRLPQPAEIVDALSRVGWNQHVTLDRNQCTIAFRQKGVEINVHSIGKGHALDRATNFLIGEGVENFLLHGGRSSLIARGHRSGGYGWKTGLRHPLNPRVRLAAFTLIDEALATSGSATQGFTCRGRRYGHILDPRTGWPAEGMHSVTVIAPTATEADALSTAFYVMGPEKTASYCRTRPYLKVLLVVPGGRPGEIELQTINLPDEQWTPHTAASTS